MKAFFSKRNFFSSVISITLSVAFVASVAVASTTISTNISTEGTLTVTGASTLTGAVTTAGAVTLGDAAGDVIILTGNASTTAALTVGGNFYVGGRATTTASSGNFQMIGGLTVGDATVNSLAGTILFSAQASDPTGVTQGTVYYNSTSKVLKLFDGTSWFTTGTTTSGISLSGVRLQLADLATQHVTLGTTTQQGAGESLLTVEATTTSSIPLSLVAFDGQTADIFRVLNAGSSKLLYLTSAGALFGSSTLQVTGAVTTYGAVTLGDAVGDAITLTGNATSTNNHYVGLALTVGGNATTTSAGAISTQSTLTVSGATVLNGAVTLGDAAGDAIVLTGNASTTNALTVGTTLYVGGNATTTSAGAFNTQGTITGLADLSITGNATTSSLYASGNFNVNGMATTSSAGAISTQGKFSVGTTTAPTSEISADGTATTTIGAFSSTSLVGGCIQLKGTNGLSYRMYVGAGGLATTTPSGAAGFIGVWEAGSCK